MSKLAFIFPGQGSQTVGMAEDFMNGESGMQAMALANEALGFSLSNLMKNGPQEELTLTYHAQPALLTSGVLIAEQLREAGVDADYVAGHSLGEYAALVYAGVLSFEEALVTVHKRGQYMDQAVPAGEGAMAAILNMAADELKAVCDEVTKEGHPVQLANVNCPGQIVISGTKRGVEDAGALAKERGAKRVIPLVVSGPFHSALMSQAAFKLNEHLQTVNVVAPKLPVISNVTSEQLTTKEQIVPELVSQVTSPVLWQQNVEQLLAQGVTTFIECGPGKVLSGLVKKIAKDVTILSVYDETTLQAALQTLKGVEQA
ncbi:MAG: ACP S-malonyltransferase [Lysinibacillus sp.]